MANDTDRRTDVPGNLDEDKLAEAALALLSLTFDGVRVWKSLDWNLMNLLHNKGWISDPISKAKSVALTPEGERLATAFLTKHFAKTQARSR
jgi:hypothetical protein